MNTKQLNLKYIKKLKKFTPNIYNETMNISLPFYILSNLLYNKGEQILANSFDLTQTQLDVLISLYYASDDLLLTPSQLYKILSFSSGGMTKVLKALEEKRYIIRIDNKDDKRSKLVKITKSGQNITEKAIESISNIEKEYFAKLDKKEQKQFEEILYKILE